MKKLLLLGAFVCVALTGMTQDYKIKWNTITKEDIVLTGAMVLSGTADGVNQAVVHRNIWKGHAFSDFTTSWKRKYRDYDAGDLRPAYFGSKSFLVGITDMFHLTRSIDHLSLYTGIVFGASDIVKYRKQDKWKVLLIKKPAIILIRSVTFNLIFNSLRKNK